jgi:hypothetical protein
MFHTPASSPCASFEEEGYLDGHLHITGLIPWSLMSFTKLPKQIVTNQSCLCLCHFSADIGASSAFISALMLQELSISTPRDAGCGTCLHCWHCHFESFSMKLWYCNLTLSWLKCWTLWHSLAPFHWTENALSPKKSSVMICSWIDPLHYSLQGVRW